MTADRYDLLEAVTANARNRVGRYLLSCGVTTRSYRADSTDDLYSVWTLERDLGTSSHYAIIDLEKGYIVQQGGGHLTREVQTAQPTAANHPGSGM